MPNPEPKRTEFLPFATLAEVDAVADEFLRHHRALPLVLSPNSLDGTTVRMSLTVDDPDSTAAQAIAAGAREIFPVADQPMACDKDESPTRRVITGSSESHSPPDTLPVVERQSSEDSRFKFLK